MILFFFLMAGNSSYVCRYTHDPEEVGVRKTTCLLSALVIISVLYVHSNASGKDVFLLIGQSNMVGRGQITAADEGEVQKVYLFNRNDDWELATNPIARYSNISGGGDLSLGYAYALKMREYRPSHDQYLVVNPKAATSLPRNWMPENHALGTRQLYDSTLARIRRALATDPENRIRAILWHQGESDHRRPERYMDSLYKFITRWRAVLNEPDLPFIAGEIVESGNDERTFNEHLRTLPDLLPYTAVVSSDGAKNDGLHFNRAGAFTMGNRYADAVMDLVYRPTSLSIGKLHLQKRRKHTRALHISNTAIRYTRTAIPLYELNGRRITAARVIAPGITVGNLGHEVSSVSLR